MLVCHSKGRTWDEDVGASGAYEDVKDLRVRQGQDDRVMYDDLHECCLHMLSGR